MSQPTEQQLLRLFAKMPQPLQEEVLESMIQSYYSMKQKNSNDNRACLYRKALLGILENYEKKLKIGSAKKHTRELDSLLEKSDLRVKMICVSSERRATKRNKLLKQYAPLIVHLKEQKSRSFVFIQAYLATHHKLKVDSTYLCKLYPEILENGKSKIADNCNKETNSVISKK